jgi:hypothetical protein
MLTSTVIAFGLVLAAVPAVPDDDCRRFLIATGDRPVLHVVNGNGALDVSKRRRDVELSLDGHELSPAAIRRQGPILTVLDPGGRPLFMVGVFRSGPGDGQLVYAPDLDPTTTEARLGLRSEPADASTRRVSKVCSGLPADVAGLEPDDIIVSVDGQAPVTEQLLHESAARKAGGEQVRLSVLRDGQPREVVLTTGAAAEWPVPEQLESYLRQVIGD